MVGFCLRFAFCPCHASHIMSSCAFHLHTCSSHASEHFSPLSVLHSGTPTSSGVPFCLFSCAVVKRSRIRPRFAKRPWYATGRPPVKFHAIWSSFDTPTVNRGPVKASCVLQPNTPPKWPKTHLNPLHPLSRSITIAWLKTTPHLDSPSSQNL